MKLRFELDVPERERDQRLIRQFMLMLAAEVVRATAKLDGDTSRTTDERER